MIPVSFSHVHVNCSLRPGLHEEVPKVSPDPGVRRQRSRRGKPQRRRRRVGDGEALRD